MCFVISVCRGSNREVDAEIDAFLGSKSPKKPVDPLSYIKVSENQLEAKSTLMGTNELCIKINFTSNVLMIVSYRLLQSDAIFEEIPH